MATLEPVLGPDLLCAHCVDVRTTRSRCSPSGSVPIAHCPRSNALLGCGIAPLARSPSRGDHRRSRHRLACIRPELRPLRGAADGDLRRPGAGTTRRGALRDGSARARDDRRGARPATRRRGGYPDGRQARRPDGRFAGGKPLPSGGGPGGGGRLRWLAGPSARNDRRRTDPLPEGRRDAVARGTQHRKRRPTANASNYLAR